MGNRIVTKGPGGNTQDCQVCLDSEIGLPGGCGQDKGVTYIEAAEMLRGIELSARQKLGGGSLG